MRFTEATHCASRTDFVTRAGKKTWPKPRRNWTPAAIPATRNSPPYESHIPHPGGFNTYRNRITCRSSFAHGAGLHSKGPLLQDDRAKILETTRTQFVLARRHDRRPIVNQTLSPAGTGTVNAPASPLQSVEKFTRSIRLGARPVGGTGGGNRFIIPVRFDGDDVEARVARIERLLALELTARDVAERGLPARVNDGQLAAIAEIVAAHFGLELLTLREGGRADGIVWPRMVAVFLQRMVLNAKFQQMADWWGVDTGTPQHNCRRVRNRIETEPKFRASVQQLQAEVSRLLNTHP